jgi:transcription initiation factor TFIID TATA-box-binding protein
MYTRLSEDGPLTTIYRSGKYIIRASSFKELQNTRDELVELFKKVSIKEVEDSFGIRNIVCIENVGRELNLNRLAIDIGYEQVEYEPEQFPALIYRIENAVVLVFGSGKAVVTGATNMDEAQKAFSEFTEEID